MTQIELLEEELQKLEVKYISMILEYRKEKRLIFEKAKEMHKQEIIDAFDEGQEYEYQYHINNAPKFDSQTYYQETFVSKGSDKHKEKLKELYPDAYSILGEVLYKKCQFEPTTNTSSATLCKHCGREKYLHKL
jgi:hypothetical protein